MELWDLYNERRELLQQDHVRGQALRRVLTIWLCIFEYRTAKDNF